MRRNEWVEQIEHCQSRLAGQLAARAPSLQSAREYSLKLIETLEGQFELNQDAVANLASVIAAGSLGRLEAHGNSDFDGLLITRTAGAVIAPGFFDLVAAAGLKPPKADGIYREGVAAPALCQLADRGSLDEPAARFGKRMQLLLDARAIIGRDACSHLQRQVLDWYAGDYLGREPEAQWTLLLNDLSRYLHAYAAWQQYKRDRDAADGWYLRQAKLRSSRMLGFAGLLFLLGESSTLGQDKLGWLATHLQLSPLERVAMAMDRVDPQGFSRLLVAYDRVHALLASASLRRALIEASPEPGAALPARFPEPYAEIHALTATLLRELSSFVLGRRAEWHPDFFSYLLF